MRQRARLEQDLNSFDPALRAKALSELALQLQQGNVEVPTGNDLVNMHCHTFFSFNAYGHSPSSLAWLGRTRGYKLMGIVDFDVLDGVDEFLDACDTVGLRGSAGIETRVFVPEYGDQGINSPGEPGVCYHMGIGFASGQPPVQVASILADLGHRAWIFTRRGLNSKLDLIDHEAIRFFYCPRILFGIFSFYKIWARRKKKKISLVLTNDAPLFKTFKFFKGILGADVLPDSDFSQVEKKIRSISFAG